MLTEELFTPRRLRAERPSLSAIGRSNGFTRAQCTLGLQKRKWGRASQKTDAIGLPGLLAPLVLRQERLCAHFMSDPVRFDDVTPRSDAWLSMRREEDGAKGLRPLVRRPVVGAPGIARSCTEALPEYRNDR